MFEFSSLIIMMLVMIGVWLLLRMVVLWYFKINERKELLEKILNELSVMNGDKSPYKIEKERKEQERLEREQKEKEEEEKNNNQEKNN